MIALVLVGLLVSQAITMAIILFLPPPPRAMYRVADLAAALGHRVVKTSEGGRLDIGELPDLARVRPPTGFSDAWAQAQLAAVLRVQPGRVRVFRIPPSRSDEWVRPLSHMWDGGPPRPRENERWRGAGGPPPWAFERPRRGETPPWAERGFLREGTGEGRRSAGAETRPHGFPRRQDPSLSAGDGGPPLWGRFVAAVQQPSGRWLVAQPAPAPFPSEWQRRMLMWLGGSVVLLGLMGLLFARRITAPLAQFAEAAHRFGTDPNSPPMLLDGPAEIGVAARAFNDMQTRLKRYVADRTAMVGAISHDLRTPLARVRFKLERSPGPLATSIAPDLQQMEDMISAVLAFVRDGHDLRDRQTIDVVSLLECVVDEAVEVGGAACLHAADTLAVDGDPIALKRLFANLVTNAVKHGGSAEVRVAVDKNEALVEVRDEGPGIAEQDLERVFEPFYRADRARNLDAGGIGLGLAVARSIAREHGGELTLAPRKPGLSAIVRIPLACKSSVAMPRADAA